MVSPTKMQVTVNNTNLPIHDKQQNKTDQLTESGGRENEERSLIIILFSCDCYKALLTSDGERAYMQYY